jgi:hypothetical protein
MAETAAALYEEGLTSLRAADEAHAAVRNGNAIATHDGHTLLNAAAIAYGDQMQRGGMGYLLAALVRSQLEQTEDRTEVQYIDQEKAFKEELFQQLVSERDAALAEQPPLTVTNWRHQCAEKKGAVVILGGADVDRCACGNPTEVCQIDPEELWRSWEKEADERNAALARQLVDDMNGDAELAAREAADLDAERVEKLARALAARAGDEIALGGSLNERDTAWEPYRVDARRILANLDGTDG